MLARCFVIAGLLVPNKFAICSCVNHTVSFSSRTSNHRMVSFGVSNLLYHRIGAMFAAAAFAAKRPSPDGIELLDKRIDERGIIGEDAVFEVALALRLRTHARASEIGAAAQSRR